MKTALGQLRDFLNEKLGNDGSISNFGFKNRLINAAGLINQREVSGTVTLAAGVYGHDRFKAGASGCTYTFSTSGNVTTFTIAAGSLVQVIEGLNLETGTYCLSWAGSAQAKIASGAFAASGVTATITGGTNTSVEFGTGTLALPQFERGTTATAFDYRLYPTELALCQRYLPVVNIGSLMGLSFSSTVGSVSCNFPVPARTGSNGITTIGTFAVQFGNGTSSSASVTFSESSIFSSSLNITSSGMTAGAPLRLFNGTPGAAKIIFNGCEL